MAIGNSVPLTQRDVFVRLAHARDETDLLFKLLTPEALYERPIAARHRIVFYIGHLEAFDWNLFREHLPGMRQFHSVFDQLFAFGIDPVGGGLPTDNPSDWPAIRDVREYVKAVRQRLDTGLDGADLSAKVRFGEQEFPLSVLVDAALEHRLMHAETLAYMLHQMPLDTKRRPSHAPEGRSGPVIPGTVLVPAGRARMGLSPTDDAGEFGWDNEYEAHDVHVPEFEIDRYKVTNSEYLRFVREGGYDDAAYWKEADWQWRTAEDVRHPVFWTQRGESWYLRLMFEEIPLPPDWPVYVSYAEASAYARWACRSIPTEEQWQRAAWGGGATLSPERDNFGALRWDPVPVNLPGLDAGGFGARGMCGNGWEWTSTVFGPFPGFRPFPFYPGYSANFFDGKHFVLKGGSARTAAVFLRPSFRNWFQPHYQYPYAGFRCVNR